MDQRTVRGWLIALGVFTLVMSVATDFAVVWASVGTSHAVVDLVPGLIHGNEPGPPHVHDDAVFEWEAKTFWPAMHQVFWPARKVTWAFYVIGVAQLLLAWRVGTAPRGEGAVAATVGS